MKDTNTDKPKVYLRKLPWIFVLAIAFVCGLLYIFNFRNVSFSGGYFTPELALAFLSFFVTVLFVIVAVVLKCIFKKRVRFWVLLLASLLLPWFCFQINCVAFAKGGFLYPLIEDGGILHFIVIGDYNLDGMNDKEYHILYDERRESSIYNGHFDDTVIDNIQTVATGTGSGLSGCFCFYDWEERIIKLYLDRDSVKLKQIEITVYFQDPSMVSNASFYIDGNKLEHTVNEFGAASIVFDADECLAFQKSLDTERRNIPIKYVIDEQ